MSIEKQQLLSLKEENLKFKENFDKFLKKHEANKKFISKNHVRDFMEEQKSLMDNINQQIDEIIAQDKQTAKALPQKRIPCTLPQKRTRSCFSEETIKASKRPRKEVDNVKTHLEIFIETPGLQHLAENIFLHLNYKDLISCQIVNQSSRTFLENPRFWVKKFNQRGLSKQNEINWINAIQITKNTDFERNISFYLKRSLKKEKLKDLACFIGESTLAAVASYHPRQDISFYYPKDHTPGCIQIMALTVDDDLKFYSAPHLMERAAREGHFEFIKAIIPFIDKPNAYEPCLESSSEEIKLILTPISQAAKRGYLEIIKFLIPLSHNVNVIALQYAIKYARIYDHYHVVQYLESLMNSQ